jgi:hypothetical protein
MIPSSPEWPELSGSRTKAEGARLFLSFLPSGGRHHRHDCISSPNKIGVRPAQLISVYIYKESDSVLKKYFLKLCEGMNSDLLQKGFNWAGLTPFKGMVFIDNVY